MSTYQIKEAKGYFISNKKQPGKQEPYGIVDIGDIMIRESKCSNIIPIDELHNHICLSCGGKQPEPTNPLKWCLNCFSTRVVNKENSIDTEEGGYIFIEINKDSSVLEGEFGIWIDYDIEKFGDCIHNFYCDKPSVAYDLLMSAVNAVNNTNPLYPYYNLTQEQISYIKTITSFKDGKFHFKGEDA